MRHVNVSTLQRKFQYLVARHRTDGCTSDRLLLLSCVVNLSVVQQMGRFNRSVLLRGRLQVLDLFHHVAHHEQHCGQMPLGPICLR